MRTVNRRDFLKAAGAAAGLTSFSSLSSLSLSGCAAMGGAGGKHSVVVVGGGFGGATAARYLKRWSGGAVDVTLVERDKEFISCPLSNLVVGGSKTLGDITRGYGALSKEGVRVVHDEVAAIDPEKREVKLAGGQTLRYERLVLSPGVAFQWEQIPGLADAGAREQILHAWKAGAQTVALRKQLEAMPDGGVYAITIPLAPYRCPPGPYERACQVAHYFKQAKPKSKVLVLDANDKIVSKPALFDKAFKEMYGGIIEYRPNAKLLDVDVATRTAKLEFDDVKADVLNVVPPQRAADIAKNAGLITTNNKWCEVDWLSMESKAQPRIHVLGDAVLAAPAMPKSGHMANQHGKIAAAAIIELLDEHAPGAAPVAVNTCYSFVDDKKVIHVSSVHQYNAEKKILETVKDAGGVSKEANELEGEYALSWAKNIWTDMLG
jgi:sulfide dehydrogenase [flavocytochrome c] flavoprotein chain